MDNTDNNEAVYLTAKEIDEIEKLQTTNDVVDYMEGMSNAKKQLVMKLFDKELVIKQWQTIAAERY